MIKDYLRSPLFYMVAVPVLAGAWMIYAWTLAYPSSVQKWNASKTEYDETQKTLEQILRIEPQRLTFQQEKSQATGFDYAIVIDQFTKQFGIASDNYTFNVRDTTKKAGKTVKSADLAIKTIDIENFCKFLSAILTRWPELECETLRLDRLPTGKNAWKVVNVHFIYYY
ncbi:MAG: hypothetical protein FJ263_08435 [Planctomycetes bacterium]|nr:hypothetical protein [Planctomycetota bacterium]